jgi:Raf kinase inhibitor-like YbhB/YbcL family protein
MQLGSSAFANDATIPRRFTCDGEDLSPPLDWIGTPAETHSLVLLCDDPDAPAGTWHHWAAYDIATDRAGLAEGATLYADRQGFKQAVNDFHRSGYGGPCPPRGHGPHHYHFRYSGCSRFQPTTCHCAKIRPAVTSNARPVSIWLPRRP